MASPYSNTSSQQHWMDGDLSMTTSAYCERGARALLLVSLTMAPKNEIKEPQKSSPRSWKGSGSRITGLAARPHSEEEMGLKVRGTGADSPSIWGTRSY